MVCASLTDLLSVCAFMQLVRFKGGYGRGGTVAVGGEQCRHVCCWGERHPMHLLHGCGMLQAGVDMVWLAAYRRQGQACETPHLHCPQPSQPHPLLAGCRGGWEVQETFSWSFTYLSARTSGEGRQKTTNRHHKKVFSFINMRGTECTTSG